MGYVNYFRPPPTPEEFKKDPKRYWRELHEDNARAQRALTAQWVFLIGGTLLAFVFGGGYIVVTALLGG